MSKRCRIPKKTQNGRAVFRKFVRENFGGKISTPNISPTVRVTNLCFVAVTPTTNVYLAVEFDLYFSTGNLDLDVKNTTFSDLDIGVKGHEVKVKVTTGRRGVTSSILD